MTNSKSETMYFFEYVKEMVALKCNKRDFTCSFGRELAGCSKKDFEKCAIQAEVYFISDQEVRRKIDEVKCAGKWKKFHYFGYDAERGILFYERRGMRCLDMCYLIRLREKSFSVYVGNTYERLIKLKISNLHPVKEIVSDILEMLLLRSGYAAVYCSAAYCQESERTLLLFSAPRTGKTRTCMTLCEKYGFKYISEDIAVTDGRTIYGAPWTGSFRDYKGNDSARQGNSKGTQWLRKQNNISCENATDIAILEKAAENSTTREENEKAFEEKLLSLQRYAIHYYWSPAITALGYFDPKYRQDGLMDCDRRIIHELCRRTENWNLTVSGNAEFADFIVQAMQNEKKLI